MRTTIDLINELHAVAEGAETAALIIGFPNTTTYVYANEANPLASLIAAINAGGHPVGIIRTRRTKNAETGRSELTAEAGPLAEYTADEHIRRYLEDLMVAIERELKGRV